MFGQNDNKPNDDIPDHSIQGALQSSDDSQAQNGDQSNWGHPGTPIDEQGGPTIQPTAPAVDTPTEDKPEAGQTEDTAQPAPAASNDLLDIKQKALTQLTPIVDNIVFAGMGGSALAALLYASWPVHTKPFTIVRDYDIPDYVNERTYFIASSYSGNTEETLNALKQAEAKGAQIAILAGGGELVKIAQEKNYPLALIPKAEQPRYAVFYSFKGLLTLLQQAGLTETSGVDAALTQAANFLKEAAQAWVPTVPTDNNQAKQIALDVIGNSAVIYSGPKLFPAAYKWKISFNENAKHVAWTNQLPEFNHNEFMGWTEQPDQKPYTVIDLRSNLEHARVQKRFEVTERLLSGKRPAPIAVNVQGSSVFEQVIWAITLGDFVTIYTALLGNINPAPVDLIEKFKKSLDE